MNIVHEKSFEAGFDMLEIIFMNLWLKLVNDEGTMKWRLFFLFLFFFSWFFFFDTIPCKGVIREYLLRLSLLANLPYHINQYWFSSVNFSYSFIVTHGATNSIYMRYGY